MKNLILGALCAMVLVGCGERQVQFIKEEERIYTVTYVNPPKRYSVSVRDDVTGVEYPNAYRSKRCSGYQRYPVGSKVALWRVTWREGNREITDFRGNGDVFCH